MAEPSRIWESQAKGKSLFALKIISAGEGVPRKSARLWGPMTVVAFSAAVSYFLFNYPLGDYRPSLAVFVPGLVLGLVIGYFVRGSIGRR